MDIHVFAAASKSHNFVGVPFGWSEYENAANFPSGDQLSALIVKLNGKGTGITSSGGQFASNTQVPDTLTN
jgi:hypothetical protein